MSESSWLKKCWNGRPRVAEGWFARSWRFYFCATINIKKKVLNLLEKWEILREKKKEWSGDKFVINKSSIKLASSYLADFCRLLWIFLSSALFVAATWALFFWIQHPIKTYNAKSCSTKKNFDNAPQQKSGNIVDFVIVSAPKHSEKCLFLINTINSYKLKIQFPSNHISWICSLHH